MTEQRDREESTDEERHPVVDPALLRGITERRFSRRDLLRYAGYGAGGVVLTSFLQACSVKGAAPAKTPLKPGTSPSAIDYSKYYGNGQAAGTLNFANWPAYIDVNSKGKSPTLMDFTKATGTRVNYKEVINDNDPFLAKILPVLQSGQDTGYDLMVLTNGGFVEKLINLGYLIPLDPKYLPNFEQYASVGVKNPNYDPGNQFSVAWQSGYTGIAYNSKVVTTPPTSFMDLINATQYKGKVGMFGNDQDLPCPALVAMGFDIDKSTPDQWQKAADLLKKQKDAGIVRNYYDQSYLDALTRGDLVLSQAWSGDIFQASAPKAYGGLGHSELKFVFPNEGGILWTDNMCIPVHAQHPVDAIKFMDFVYQPKIAAQIADYVWYISPVPAAKDIVLNQLDDPTAANSPLIFPSEQDLAQAHKYKVFKSTAEHDQWDNIFQPIYSS